MSFRDRFCEFVAVAMFATGIWVVLEDLSVSLPVDPWVSWLLITVILYLLVYWVAQCYDRSQQEQAMRCAGSWVYYVKEMLVMYLSSSDGLALVVCLAPDTGEEFRVGNAVAEQFIIESDHPQYELFHGSISGRCTLRYVQEGVGICPGKMTNYLFVEGVYPSGPTRVVGSESNEF